MKKTIITAILALGLAGSASAALTLTDNFKLEDAVVNEQDFDGSTLSYTGSFAAQGNPYDTSDSSTRGNMTFTLVLDVDQLGSQSGYIVKGGSWGVGYNDDGKAQGWWGSSFYSGGPTTANALSSYADENGLVTLTIVTGYVTSTSQASRIYVGDGTTYWTASGLKFGSGISSITINQNFKDAIEQFYVFDTALSSDQVTQVYNMAAQVTAGTYVSAAAIPEPASATLSLLALAGLAARRRRK